MYTRILENLKVIIPINAKEVLDSLMNTSIFFDLLKFLKRMKMDEIVSKWWQLRIK